MIWKYGVACAVVFAILAFLRFVEDSPVRSWKTVFLIAIPLSFVICYYVSCAFPAPPPPQPRQAKVASNRAELERTFRRIGGVSRANVNGSIVEINFSENKPLNELKSIARDCGAASAYFLALDKTNRITIRVLVQERRRYQMDYDLGRGIVNEEEF